MMAPLVAVLWSSLLALLLHASYLGGVVSAFSDDRSDNLAAYWGQDSGGHQQRLSFYCDDDTIDVFPLAFLYIFRGTGGLPVIDFSNICGIGSGRTFAGTDLTDCSFLASDIRDCQAKGKIVTLSLGGATSQVGFSSDAQAEQFGQLLWDMFLGGNGNIRPLGNVALDGVDLDIEKGTSAHYAAMVNKIRSLAKGASKRYYITAAPQCPFPDVYIGGALNSAFFDAVYVQFYNNYCETSVPSEFNFDTWDRWARTQSPNRHIKVYMGAPGSPKAAGNGYVDALTLSRTVKDAKARYSSFGGVMLWDADAAYTNNRYDRAIKNALTGGTQPPGRPGSSSSTKQADPAGATASSLPDITLPTLPPDFKDPRMTARVKRPSFTLDILKTRPHGRPD
ncbi:putative glycosyl hydrolases family 18 [Lyophyllum shimeji]|uniref:chitinase n=1 Tax=Lyophyllum shimeji TaxID=47721 RepID=A0A9P3UKI4_LYOSH|nr:putative glycosyl hydrolases family 18 [Lyophyllum shimeji]